MTQPTMLMLFHQHQPMPTWEVPRIWISLSKNWWIIWWVRSCIFVGAEDFCNGCQSITFWPLVLCRGWSSIAPHPGLVTPSLPRLRAYILPKCPRVRYYGRRLALTGTQTFFFFVEKLLRKINSTTLCLWWELSMIDHIQCFFLSRNDGVGVASRGSFGFEVALFAC